MIRMNDFASEPAELLQQEVAACERVLRSGNFILGNELGLFEERWARFCGVKFCAGVGNGTEAIELGLRALEIGRGDEVITTAMTAIPTVFAIIHAGATPVFADIDPETALLDLQSVKRCMSPRTRAVLLVHLYGRASGMGDWTAFCRDAGIHLLEDCAQAHGAFCDDQSAGSFGAWGAFSFYPTKNLGARGDAGALITNSEEIDARVRTLRNLGTTKRNEHPAVGWNSRLDEIQAALLSARLDWLSQFNARRQELACRYSAEIKSPLIRPLRSPASTAEHVYHLFVVRCSERERLASALADSQIETLVHYPIPVHRQESCTVFPRDPNGLPHAEAHAEQCLSIPCHPQLREDEVDLIINALNQFKL